jgi:membrane associated rhomboid family serine protease
VGFLSGWLDCPPAADANAGHNGANTVTKQRIPHLDFGGGSGGSAVYGSADPGDSLLAVAAFARQGAVVRLLLDHGADWHARNDAGVSAAHAAMERGAGDLCGEHGAAQALQSPRAGGAADGGAAAVAETEAKAAQRVDAPHAEKTAAALGTAAHRSSAAADRSCSGLQRAARARWADARRYPACALLLLLQASVVAWQVLSAGLVPFARNAAIGPDPARFRAQGALPLPPGLAGDGDGGGGGSSSSGGGQGWRLVSAVLLHRGLLHLAWCAALQAVLAAPVERAAGGFGLWAVASLSGVCGHAFSRAVANEGGGSDAATSAAAPPLALALGLGRGMGAATVVFGLAGASLVVAWLRPGRSWRRSRRRVLLVASALLLFEALDTLPPPLPWWGEGVDKTGHLAGFVVGLVTGLAVVKAGTPGGGGEDSSRTVDAFHLDLPALRAPVPAVAARLGTSTAQLCSHYLRFVAATVVLAAVLCLGGYFAIYAPGSCC